MFLLPLLTGLPLDASPLKGTWKFRSLHCGSVQAPGQALKPIPWSQFSPDLHLDFWEEASLETDPNVELATTHSLKILARKSFGTQSCTNPDLQSQSTPLYEQDFHQRAHFVAETEGKGFLKGISLGAGKLFEGGISPSDCDPVFGVMVFLNGDAHATEELERIYSYEVQGSELILSYHDQTLGAQCEASDETYLIFERQ